MRGKNAGKSRARKTPPESKSSAVAVRREKSSDESAIARIDLTFQDRFGSVCLPSHLDSRMHELLYRCKFL
jgi:hypothetical protein